MNFQTDYLGPAGTPSVGFSKCAGFLSIERLRNDRIDLS